MSGVKRLLRKYQMPSRAASFDPSKAWFSVPSAFNDPLDVNLRTPDSCFSVFEDEDHLREAAKMVLKNDRIKDYAFFTDEILRALGNDDELNYESAILELAKSRFDSSGVLCLFAGGESEAMWSYYADDATGFAIDYECDGATSIALRNSHLLAIDVTYFRTLPSVPIAELIFSPSTATAKMYASKQIDWAHEEEMRFVNPEASGLLDLPCGLCVKRVVAGHRMKDEDKQTLVARCEAVSVPAYERYVRDGAIRDRLLAG